MFNVNTVCVVIMAQALLTQLWGSCSDSRIKNMARPGPKLRKWRQTVHRVSKWWFYWWSPRVHIYKRGKCSELGWIWLLDIPSRLVCVGYWVLANGLIDKCGECPAQLMDHNDSVYKFLLAKYYLQSTPIQEDENRNGLNKHQEKGK